MKIPAIRLFLLSLFIFGAQPVLAQAPIATAQLISTVESVAPGNPFWLALKLTPQAGWHTYWQNPGDSGVPTAIEWQSLDHSEVGPLHWPAPERLPYSDLVNFGYPGEVVLPMPIIAREGENSYRFSAHATWLVCHDVCIPESADLELVLPLGNGDASPDALEIEAALARVPKSVKEPISYSDEGSHLTFFIPHASLPFPVQRARIFGLESGIFAGNSVPAIIEQGNGIDIEMPKESTAKKDFEAVLSVYAEDGKREDYQYLFRQSLAALPTTNSEAASLKWVGIFFFAFLGGLILNVMPCVLPVLALKALTLARQAGDGAPLKRQGLAYTFGVLICFVGLALLLLLLQQTGEMLGWGFQLQSPIFVAVLACVMLAVGLSLVGAFYLPAFLGGVSIKDGSLQGSFLTGLLAGLVATPCTAPFMAAAVGVALTASSPIALGIFASMGLGLAAPVLLFSFLPRTTRLLPKSGPWMHHLKHFFGFLMCGSAAWLMWVLAAQTDGTGLALGLLALLLFAYALCAAYLPGWLRLGLLIICFVPLSAIRPATEPVTENRFSVERIAMLREEGRGVFVEATAAWCLICKANERTTLSRPEIQEAFTKKNITHLVADWTRGDVAITQYLASFQRRGVPTYVYYPSGSEPILLPQVLTPSILLEALETK